WNPAAHQDSTVKADFIGQAYFPSFGQQDQFGYASCNVKLGKIFSLGFQSSVKKQYFRLNETISAANFSFTANPNKKRQWSIGTGIGQQRFDYQDYYNKWYVQKELRL